MPWEVSHPRFHVHVSRITIIGMLGIAACAGNPKPKIFGTAADLTPTVEIVGTNPLPLHIRIGSPQSAYVSAFYVIPGQRTQMLFPADSAGSKLLPAGSQEVATSFATRTVTDSSRLLRRPPRAQPPVDASGIPQGGSSSGDPRANAFQETGFVLVYVSKDSLSFKTLNDRVIGVSLPGYTDEAFNTVTKLIRAASTGAGPWSAVAVPFKP
jgi:hypothetical protein